MSKGQFKIQKVMDVGTGNPIVARLSVGLYDIVNMAKITKVKKDDINEANFQAMVALVKAEKIGKKIQADIERNIESLKTGGVKTQSFDRCVEVPHTECIDEIRDYLKYSKKTLQEAVKLFKVFMPIKCSNPRYDKIINALKLHFGEKDELFRLVKEDHDLWIKKLLEYRNEDEHPTREFLYKDFDINYDNTTKRWQVKTPSFYDGTPIFGFPEATTYNLLTFCEEITILFLLRHMPEFVSVYEIPEKERDPKNPIRYRLGLSGKYQLKNKGK